VLPASVSSFSVRNECVGILPKAKYIRLCRDFPSYGGSHLDMSEVNKPDILGVVSNIGNNFRTDSV